MNDISLTIGEKILLFRRREGLSRAQVAEALGVAVQTVANYENGLTLPDVSSLNTLADILHITMDMILFDPEEEAKRCAARIVRLTQSQMRNMI